MSRAGWFHDPTGRFGRRYFDGAHWSDHVVGANGQTTDDRLPRTATGFPPPVDDGATGYDLPPPTPRSAAASTGKGEQLGALIAGAGCFLVVLSLFAFDWVDGGSFGDYRASGGNSFPDNQPFPDILTFVYAKGLDILLLGFVGTGVLLLAATKPRVGSKRTRWQLIIAIGAGVGAVVHLAVVLRLFRGPGLDPMIGAWLGTVGYLVALAGLAFRSRLTTDT